MEEKIMPIVTIGETEYYKECDMLKRWENPNALDPNNRDCMAIEKFSTAGKYSYWLGYCYNSMPTFLRAQEIVERSEGWLNGALNKDCSALREDFANEDGVLRFEALCPKKAWGVAAFILRHSELDELVGVMYSIGQQQDVEINTLFSHYYESRKAAYQAEHKGEYQKYSKRVEVIVKLDDTFFTSHKTAEAECLNRTISTIQVPDALRALFNNAVNVAGKYLAWLEEKEQENWNTISSNISEQQTEMDSATAKSLTKGHKHQSSFRSIIQYQAPDALLERLHQLIDSKNRHCADVGAVILNAKHIHGYLSRFPTKAEFECEFHLTGTWKATSNYFDANKNKCLAKASDIVIF